MSDAPPPQPQRPRSQRQDALAVLLRLREAGHVAYFAGGCVRDQLLGLEPKDWDVATDAPPDRVRQLFSHTQAVGAAFGVVLVKHRKSTIEVATFRTDLEYKNGRRPEGVRFTTAEEDAKRRDFTINGLFQDPIEGRIIDYVGGQKDLKNGLLRAIGEPNRRFEEDHLRLLRAVRFTARFNLSIEPVTEAAIRAHAPHLTRISPERIAEELRLMLVPEETRGLAWVELERLGLARVLFRQWREVMIDEPHHVPAWLAMLNLGETPAPFGLVLAVAFLSRCAAGNDVRGCLTHDQVRIGVRGARAGLKISNEEADDLAGTLEGARLLLSDAAPTVAAQKRLLARPSAPLARRLLRALASSRIHMELVRSRDAALLELSRGDVAPSPLVTGDDLTAAGLIPGPVFKRVLDAVYDAQLEDRVRSKEEAMGLAMALAREGTPGPLDPR